MRQPQPPLSDAKSTSDKSALRLQLRAHFASFLGNLTDEEFHQLLAHLQEAELADLSRETNVPLQDIRTFRSVALVICRPAISSTESRPPVAANRGAVLIDFVRKWKLTGDLARGFTNEYYGPSRARFIFQVIGNLRRELDRIRADIPASEDARILRDIMSVELREAYERKCAGLSAEVKSRHATGAASFDEIAGILFSCLDSGASQRLFQLWTSSHRQPGQTLRAALSDWHDARDAWTALYPPIPPLFAFHAVLQLLRAEERVAFSSLDGVADLLSIPLHEDLPASETRFDTLLKRLAAFCQGPYGDVPGTAPASSGGGGGGGSGCSLRGGSGGGSRPHVGRDNRGHSPHPRSPRVGSGSSVAAAAALPGTSSSSLATPAAALAAPPPVQGAALAATSSAAHPRRPPRTPIYSGDRAADETEASRRLSLGLCLNCHPSPPPFVSCRFHGPTARDPSSRELLDPATPVLPVWPA